MRREWVAAGAVALAVLAALGWLLWQAARSDCATNIFTGNATDPGGCSSNTLWLGASLLGVLVAGAVVAVGLVARPRTPLPPP